MQSYVQYKYWRWKSFEEWPSAVLFVSFFPYPWKRTNVFLLYMLSRYSRENIFTFETYIHKIQRHQLWFHLEREVCEGSFEMERWLQCVNISFPLLLLWYCVDPGQSICQKVLWPAAFRSISLVLIETVVCFNMFQLSGDWLIVREHSGNFRGLWRTRCPGCSPE